MFQSDSRKKRYNSVCSSGQTEGEPKNLIITLMRLYVSHSDKGPSSPKLVPHFAKYFLDEGCLVWFSLNNLFGGIFNYKQANLVLSIAVVITYKCGSPVF